MEPVTQIPGVTFRLVSAKQMPPVASCELAEGVVTLSAQINDLSLWEDVVKQLSCLRIYTVKDLAQQMVSVSQKKVQELQKKLRLLSVEAAGEKEVLRQRVSFLESENERLRQANEQWVEWHRAL